jgi:hypothetical protein
MGTEYVEINSGLLRRTFYSLGELADAAETAERFDWSDEHEQEWRGGSPKGVLSYARTGWDAHLTETLDIVESMVDKVEKDHDVQTFTPVWDVTGAEVDVARYLSGVPENMIDFPAIDTPRTGRVITLCATVGARSSIDPEAMIERGQIVTAFALIVARLGYACELWADSTAQGIHGQGRTFSTRVLVKGTNDILDPARVLFAYANPGMLRYLVFSIRHMMPKSWFKDFGHGLGSTVNPKRDMPEGTIYLDYHNTNDMARELRNLLSQAGLLIES